MGVLYERALSTRQMAQHGRAVVSVKAKEYSGRADWTSKPGMSCWIDAAKRSRNEADNHMRDNDSTLLYLCHSISASHLINEQRVRKPSWSMARQGGPLPFKPHNYYCLPGEWEGWWSGIVNSLAVFRSGRGKRLILPPPLVHCLQLCCPCFSPLTPLHLSDYAIPLPSSLLDSII